MSIVIVGGGLAGASAVTELREQGYQGELIVYGAEQHLPYERPPLSKSFLLGQDEFEKSLVHDADWYRDHDVDLRLGQTVTSLDIAGHSLLAADEDGVATEEWYERLLLATGATPRHLPLTSLSNTAYLRTIEDSERLKESLTEGSRIAIIGGGWIGLEVASVARQRGAQVTVYEAGELPLLKVLGREVASIFADLHRGHGVDLRLGATADESELAAADLVLVAVGVAPNVELAEAAGLAVDNGVLVDAYLGTSDEDVYAVGDIANHAHPVLGHRVRREHWDTAIEQAKVAARNILGGHEEYTRLPYFFTDQYDLGMEYVGDPGPSGYDRVDIEGSTDVLDGEAFRAFWVKNDTVVASMHVNDWDFSEQLRDAIGTKR